VLARGAVAFVGCTGSHYSPARPPYDGAAGLLHRYFWGHISDGNPPALSLFKAKDTYAQDIIGIDSAQERAIRLKTLAQFTCLGLGWW
jgi:hypothetical protein